MHLVHYSDKYESFEKALNQSDGLLVIGTVFQVFTIPNETKYQFTFTLIKFNYSLKFVWKIL